MSGEAKRNGSKDKGNGSARVRSIRIIDPVVLRLVGRVQRRTREKCATAAAQRLIVDQCRSMGLPVGEYEPPRKGRPKLAEAT